MQTIQTPNFTTAESVRDRLQERLEFTARKMIQAGCANALIVVTDSTIDEQTMSVHPGDIQYSKDHCPNDRRTGSKYCQTCSDTHNAIPTNN